MNSATTSRPAEDAEPSCLSCRHFFGEMYRVYAPVFDRFPFVVPFYAYSLAFVLSLLRKLGIGDRCARGCTRYEAVPP